MNRRTLASLLAALGAVALVAGAYLGCRGEKNRLQVQKSSDHPDHYSARFSTMGITARIEVVAPDRERAREVIEPAVEAARRVDRLMSTYRPNSDISRLNETGAHRAVAVHDWTMDVLQQAVEMWETTDGGFDVTAGPLRDLWRRAQKSDTVPTDDELKAVLQHVGSDKLVLGEGTARLKKEGMEVDLGGIAKGYAIDRAVREIKESGVDGALVDIGGDLRLVGQRSDGKDWSVKVRIPPRLPQDEAVFLDVSGMAVATSGDYARFYMVEERRFSHIVDPRTGWPVETVPSCTVVASTAARADALATGLSVLGPEKGLALIDNIEDAECLIMVKDPDDGTRVLASEGFSTYRSQSGDGAE